MSFQQRMAEAWTQPDRDILLLLSGRDFTAKEFIQYVDSNRALEKSLMRAGLERHDLPQADHTLSGRESRSMCEEVSVLWLSRHYGTSERRAIG